MRVIVRGLGNIGTTLANVLLAQRELLGISSVICHKGTPTSFGDADLELLASRGAEVLRGPQLTESTWSTIDFAFDCRAAGVPRAAREEYADRRRLVGIVVQGTEEGFGVPFVSGLNGDVIAGRRYVQVASCNAHAIATVLRTFGGSRLEQLEVADFVVVRRSEDVGSHERLVSGTVVANHRDEDGTHHARSARRLFETLGLSPSLSTSDVTTPSQLLHTLRFSVRLRGSWEEERLQRVVQGERLLATTSKFDANRVFELGRRYGFQGRLFAHAIVVSNNLHLRSDAGATELRGWAFVPQEGNTILSTIEAYLRQTRHPDPESIMSELHEFLLGPCAGAASW